MLENDRKKILIIFLKEPIIISKKEAKTIEIHFDRQLDIPQASLRALGGDEQVAACSLSLSLCVRTHTCCVYMSMWRCTTSVCLYMWRSEVDVVRLSQQLSTFTLRQGLSRNLKLIDELQESTWWPPMHVADATAMPDLHVGVGSKPRSSCCVASTLLPGAAPNSALFVVIVIYFFEVRPHCVALAGLALTDFLLFLPLPLPPPLPLSLECWG